MPPLEVRPFGHYLMLYVSAIYMLICLAMYRRVLTSSIAVFAGIKRDAV